MNLNKKDSKQPRVISILEIIPRKMLPLVMDLKLLNVDLKEVNFPEVKSKELLLQEPSLENQRYYFLTKLLLHWTKTPKQKYLLHLIKLCKEELQLLLHIE